MLMHKLIRIYGIIFLTGKSVIRIFTARIEVAARSCFYTWGVSVQRGLCRGVSVR